MWLRFTAFILRRPLVWVVVQYFGEGPTIKLRRARKCRDCWYSWLIPFSQGFNDCAWDARLLPQGQVGKEFSKWKSIQSWMPANNKAKEFYLHSEKCCCGN